MTRFSPRDLSRINLCGIVINFRTITSFGIIYGHFSTDYEVCQEIFISRGKNFSNQQGSECGYRGENRQDEEAGG